MNTTTRHFEFKDDKSSKFWEVTQSGSTVKVRFGKTGTNGQSQEKVFADEAAARKHVRALVAEKTDKGYAEQGTSSLTSVDATDAVLVEKATESKPQKTQSTPKSVKPAKPKNPAQDSEASPQSLTALLNKDDATNRLLAKHPRASSELLEKLSHSSDKATRQAVACNPNTPFEAFVRLGQQFPKEFLTNPALDLLLMVNPAMMEQVPETLLIRLLKQADCSASMLTWAAEHQQAKVQLAVAMNSGAPEVALERLSQSQHDVVRELMRSKADAAIYGNFFDPEAAFRQALERRLAELSADEADEAWVARDIGLPQWPYLAPSVRLYSLRVDVGPLVRSPYLSRALWDGMAATVHRYTETLREPDGTESYYMPSPDEGRLMRDLTLSPAAPAERLPTLLLALDRFSRWLARNSPDNPYESASVVRNPDTPSEDFKELASSEHEYVRRIVARNPTAPFEVLERLLADDSNYVRAIACANVSVPPDVAGRHLAELHDTAMKPNHLDTELKLLVAHNPRATENQLQNLFASAGDNVDLVLAVASNPSASPALLRQIVSGTDNAVRMVALANPATPADVRKSVLNQIIGERPSAIGNVWTSRMCKRARTTEIEAAQAGDMLYFCGRKDPNKTVLCKRPLAPLMALCAGPYIEPKRLVRVAGSTDWLVRAAVARNPGTPPNLLKKLSADVHPLVAALARYNEMNGSNSPDSEPDETPRLDLGRAVNEVHRRLQKSYRKWWSPLRHVIRDRAWGEQASVGEVLSALHEFLPAIEDGQRWGLVESVVAKIDPKHLGTLLKLGSKTHESWIRCHLAKTPDTPVSVIQALAKDKEPMVRIAAINNDALPTKARKSAIGSWQKLSGDRLVDLMRQPDAPLELLQVHVKCDDIDVRHAVAKHPSSPVSALEILAKDNECRVRGMVAGNPATPQDLLEALSKDTDAGVRRSVRRVVARNPAASQDLLEVLATDNDTEVRARVAMNPSAPASVLDALSKDTYEVRVVVAKHHSTPLSALEALAEDKEYQVRWKVAENPFTPVAALEILAKDSDRLVRGTVAKHLSAPLAVLKLLSKDTEFSIRLSVAERPALPIELLEVLAEDDSSVVRREVACNLSTPASLLERLSNDSDSSVRCAVASNPLAPEPLLVFLASDTDWEVQAVVALNPQASADLRDTYLQSWADRLKRALQRETSIREGRSPSPQIPIFPEDLVRATTWLGLIDPEPDNKALTKASRSKDWLTRLGVALNPSVTEGILKVLRQDSDPDVARAAAANLSAIQSSSFGYKSKASAA